MRQIAEILLLILMPCLVVAVWLWMDQVGKALRKLEEKSEQDLTGTANQVHMGTIK